MSFIVPLLISLGIGAIGGFRGRVWIMILPAALPPLFEIMSGSGRSMTGDAFLMAAFVYLVLGLLGALIGSSIRAAGRPSNNGPS